MPDHVVTATLDGDGAPFRVAATERGIAAAAWEPDEAAFASELRSRLRVPVVALAEVRPDDPAAAVLRAAIPTIERDPPRPPDRRRRPWRSTSPTVRRSTGACSTRCVASAGAARRAMAISPSGSERRERRARSAVPSGATRSRSLIPCHRIIAARRDARRVRRDGLDRSRRAAVAQGGAAAARRRHGAPAPRLDSGPPAPVTGPGRGHTREGSGAAVAPLEVA